MLTKKIEAYNSATFRNYLRYPEVNWPRFVLFIAIAVSGSGCGPILAFTLGVEQIEPEALLSERNEKVKPLVIDVRNFEKFLEGHIAGAISVSPEELGGYLFRLGPPQGTIIVTVCNRGFMSAIAASTALSRGFTNAFSLKGGMSRWTALGYPVETGNPKRWDHSLGVAPVIATSLFMQVSLVVAAFGFKPLYMFLSSVFIWVLWRAKDQELVLLRWAMISFLFGELMCAANYLFTAQGSDALEILHQLGMVGMNALLPWGLFNLADTRVLRFSDPTTPCVGIRFCRKCVKRERVSCGARQLLQFVVPSLAIVSLMPLFCPIRPINAVLPVLGTDVPYQTDVWLQLAVFRVYPLLACLSILVSLPLLIRGQTRMDKFQGFFFVGLGFMTFSFFRWVLLETFRITPFWADIWEEITELICVVDIGLLFVLFRDQLGVLGKVKPANDESA